MRSALRRRLLSLAWLSAAVLLLAGCRRPDDAPRANPRYPNPGQYTPQSPYPPQNQYPPQSQYPPQYPPQNQYPPAPAAPAFPAPWWQIPPGAFPFPIPGWPAPAPAPAAPPPGGDPAQQCVHAINQHRQTLRLPPLARWAAAEPCAGAQAQNGATTGRAHGAFGQCGEGAQNVCPGWPGPPAQMIGPCLQMMWDEGPGADFSAHGHYLNMSNPRFTRVACGFFTTPSGSTWSVQDFQ